MTKKKYQKILISGGAGFVGSNLAAHWLASGQASQVAILDNLSRKGSSLNAKRIVDAGGQFLEIDIRDQQQLFQFDDIDLIIHCAAEPSARAGYNETLKEGISPLDVIDINFLGSVNCLELARRNKADFIFLSTSRVYPQSILQALSYKIEHRRFMPTGNAFCEQLAQYGVNENFPLIAESGATRGFYGASKLGFEQLINEYIDHYDMQAIILRLGTMAGAWQMGKVDQGVISLWVMHHYFNVPLTYQGYDFKGHQVRDVLHPSDLAELLDIMIADFSNHNGIIYNAGGGMNNSLSLCQLTDLTQKIVGKTCSITEGKQAEAGDIPWYVSDHRKISSVTGWQPNYSLEMIIEEINNWIKIHESTLNSTLF